MFGWAGKNLRVDLSKRKVVKEPLNKELVHRFIGGRGINSKTLFDELEPGINPYSPDNKLIFGTGPLAGTFAPASARWTVTTKSPLTGILGDAHAGGHWAAELKFAGYDHIVLQGKAKKPVYLSIDDCDIELRDASEIWGEDTWKTQRFIKEDLGDPNIQVVCIGPAGERLVRFACIIHSLKRAAGRTGMGAVMGSKNLKAIAVRGTGVVRVAKPGKFRKVVRKLRETILNSPEYGTTSTQGTTSLTELLNEVGRLLVKNYQRSTIPNEDLDAISGSTLFKKYVVKNRSCFACPVHCSAFFKVTEGPYAGVCGDRPEYGCIGANGPNCGIHSLPSLLKINNLLNQYGLDAVSFGHTMGAAMEWYQRGIITRKDTEGICLEWGNSEAYIKMMEKVAKREGFGDILAEGALRAAKKIGKNAANYVQHVKGLEIHSEVRPYKGFALHFPTATRGADHLRGFPFHIEFIEAPKELLDEITDDETIANNLKNRDTYEHKEISVTWCQHQSALIDSLGLCDFISTGLSYMLPNRASTMTKLFYAATGVEMSTENLEKVGERIYNVERAFNVREGITKKDDILPNRMFDEAVVNGPAKGAIITRAKFEEMRERYYKLRGWDLESGIPTRRKLEELGLKDVADELGIKK